jgi:hypothetical protein
LTWVPDLQKKSGDWLCLALSDTDSRLHDSTSMSLCESRMPARKTKRQMFVHPFFRTGYAILKRTSPPLHALRACTL